MNLCTVGLDAWLMTYKIAASEFFIGGKNLKIAHATPGAITNLHESVSAHFFLTVS